VLQYSIPSLVLRFFPYTYTKSGGKNSKHGWVPEVSGAAVSYTPVQIFENLIGHQFRAVPQVLTWLQVKQFALMPSSYGGPELLALTNR
jgi:hypothetical protein